MWDGGLLVHGWHPISASFRFQPATLNRPQPSYASVPRPDQDHPAAPIEAGKLWRRGGWPRIYLDGADLLWRWQQIEVERRRQRHVVEIHRRPPGLKSMSSKGMQHGTAAGRASALFPGATIFTLRAGCQEGPRGSNSNRARFDRRRARCGPQGRWRGDAPRLSFAHCVCFRAP